MTNYLDIARVRTVETMDTSGFSRQWRDVPYGPIARERLDIYLPEAGGGPFPVVLQITGGGWVFGDKSMQKMRDMVETTLSRGFALVSMNYSLSDEAKYPTQILQVKAAIRFLRQRADDYLLDGNEVFLYGNSAGGYLALMAGYTDTRDPDFDVPRPGQEGVDSRVAAIAAIYPITQLSGNREKMLALGLEPEYECDTPRSMEGHFMGFDTRLHPELVRAASPLSYVRPGYPPTLLQHGTHDRTVCVKQSYDLAEALLAADESRVRFTWFAGLDHSDPLFKSAENTHKILDFFSQYRRSRSCNPR